MDKKNKGNDNKPKSGELNMGQLKSSGMPLRQTIASNKAPAMGSRKVKGKQ